VRVNTIGFDDAPFAREHRGDILLVGIVCARTRMDGVVSTRVRRDGTNSTERMAKAILSSGYRTHLHAVLLQGIAVGGFNVVDIHALHRAVDLPVLVVARRPPQLGLIRAALVEGPRPVPGGARKWALIERAGPMEPLGALHVQRAGLDLSLAKRIVERTTLHGNIPEPLRMAHLVAGGVTTGRSRGRT
jgi:endonuclease V-like protein UPF0215 family